SKQLNQGIFIGCLFLVITVGVVYHSGALSNLYFYQQHGKVAVEMSSDIDKIIPLFINESMPNWFTILLMLCIISASMSTLSSQFHTMGTSVASDIYVDGIKKGQAPKHFTKWIKFGVLVSILISYVVCYMLEESIIARGTAMFMGMCAAAFLPCYFAMLYWKKVTRQGALWSIVSGFISCLFCIVFLHQKEAVALGWCQAIFHKAVLIEAHPFPLIDPLLFSLPLSALVLVLVSLATYEKEARQK
ncbi:MAG: sodium:solute symporter family protein, partial [Bacteroidales bacterium]|nr:sodium:solute symporter family protein [Bacteroidales bacterium]